MQELTPEGQRIIQNIAQRHGVSADAALTLLRALVAGQGTMAQFSHTDLGGMGQWSVGGMMNDRNELRRLEAATAPKSRLVVADGYSDAEHEAKIAALKAKGKASDRDLIVCIRKFSHPIRNQGARA